LELYLAVAAAVEQVHILALGQPLAALILAAVLVAHKQ
jgi:hypothetical protein